MHESKQYLLKLVPLIREFLWRDARLRLHDKKMYLQHFSQGVEWLGVMLKPGRIYAGRRTKAGAYRLLRRYEALNGVLSDGQKGYLCSAMNSYLGMMRHYDTYRLRQKITSRLCSLFPNMFKIDNHYVCVTTTQPLRK